MSAQKVFGIGFQKTGTTTLGVILDRLGYRTAGYHQFRDLAQTQGVTTAMLEARAHEVMKGHDAAKDTPWPVLYKELDRSFPGAKFIHVERDADAWLKSAVKDFGSNSNEIHRLIYGVPCPEGHEEIWRDRYLRHNREVREHFAGRPGDFLSLRLEDLSFETVCPFLGKPVLEAEVPTANTHLKKRLKMAWWRFARRF